MAQLTSTDSLESAAQRIGRQTRAPPSFRQYEQSNQTLILLTGGFELVNPVAQGALFRASPGELDRKGRGQNARGFANELSMHDLLSFGDSALSLGRKHGTYLVRLSGAIR